MQFGERVKDARLARKWTQQELAEAADVAIRTVVNIEKGARPSMDTYRKLASTLHLSISANGTAPMNETLRSVAPATAPSIALPDGLRVVPAEPMDVGMRVMAYVAAGHGGWDDETDGEVVMLPSYLFGADDLLVQAKGESMVDEGIDDGDYLIVERRHTGIARHGELVIAWLNDGLVIKRWYRRGGKKFLESANEEMGWKPREITPDDVFEIQAVVRHIVKQPVNRAKGASQRVARDGGDTPSPLSEPRPRPDDK